MTIIAQDAINAWIEILGEHGPLCMHAVNAIKEIPPDVFGEAIGRINRCESIAPLIDPSAWMGDRFESAQEWKTVLNRLRELSRCLSHAANPNDVATVVDLALFLSFFERDSNKIILNDLAYYECEHCEAERRTR
jgi:hypothetical protein